MNWLSSHTTYTDQWMLDNIPEYKSIVFNDEIEDLCVLQEEDLTMKKFIKENPDSHWEIDQIKWINEIVDSENPIREIMALFWYFYFPTAKSIHRNIDQEYINILRKNALGNFRELIIEVSNSGSMMYFLGSKYSSKDAPNENFPRELFELYLLGIGNFSLADVKEASAALTGRRIGIINSQTKYYIDGEKSDNKKHNILGKKDFFNLEGIIDLALSKRAASIFVVGKFMKFLFGQEFPNTVTDQIAEEFRLSNYSNLTLFQSIIEHPYIKYNPVLWRSSVKGPIELLICFSRQTGLKFKGIHTIDFLSKEFGQKLFSPPSVKGWPVGQDWLHNQWLLKRMVYLTGMIEIANRTFLKEDVTYKIHSRLNSIKYRYLRHQCDAIWDKDNFYNTLEESQFTVQNWLIPGVDYKCGLNDCLSHPKYQFHL